MKTILELSKEFGVSKEAVRQALLKMLENSKNRDEIARKDENGQWQVTANGCHQLAANLSGKSTNTKENGDKDEAQSEAELFKITLEVLRAQLEAKDEQIKTLQEQNTNLVNALSQAQALHAGTIKQQLIENSSEPEQPAEPKEPEEPAPKLSFFKRWFG